MKATVIYAVDEMRLAKFIWRFDFLYVIIVYVESFDVNVYT
ncbi:hypothetical protein PCC7424_3975 [Gloeothece citriformis PCC 7424]|uniref:Uncharacterized protein n=1 Tax=Gloeothece citriformis (strain PCC 7424) TaxID=65393 RepID=B7KKL6_GLOC7|nr:hypothetical protein [Gloeothece citriformis]ACK72349.1 hypothetical protein PCC7424_3975 [Gloeothece citriformis PCC 7424]